MTDETIIGILGLFMIYSMVHYIIISFSKTWKERSGYEQVITIIGIISITSMFVSQLQ